MLIYARVGRERERVLRERMTLTPYWLLALQEFAPKMTLLEQIPEEPPYSLLPTFQG